MVYKVAKQGYEVPKWVFKSITQNGSGIILKMRRALEVGGPSLDASFVIYEDNFKC